MKKFIPLVLALVILLLPMAGSVHADNHGLSDELAQTNTEFLPGSVPAHSTQLDAIESPIHALVLSMLENNLNYDANSDLFVWTALYYTLSMYGATDSRAEMTDNALLFPAECPQDFSHALFADLDQLPQIPAELADRISFEDGDHYQLALGDFGLNEIVLGALSPVSDTVYTLDGTLIDPASGLRLCSFTVTLEKNDTMFDFSILHVVLS